MTASASPKIAAVPLKTASASLKTAAAPLRQQQYHYDCSSLTKTAATVCLDSFHSAGFQELVHILWRLDGSSFASCVLSVSLVQQISGHFTTMA